MLKSKKVISMLLVAIIFLIGYASVFAEENFIRLKDLDNLQKVVMTKVENITDDSDPYAMFPEIGSEVTLYDENGEPFTATVGGYVEAIVTDPTIKPAWISNWFTNVNIPRNIDGNQGVQIGLDYIATIYDQYAGFSTKNWNAYLNRLNFSVTERIGNTSTVYYGYVTSPGDVIVPGLSLIQGRSYSYRFSSEQTHNYQSMCDIQLFSAGV